MNRRRVMISNTGDWIDQFKVNEDLAIKSATFKTSSVTRNKYAILVIVPLNLDILGNGVIQNPIVIDHLTNEPVELYRYAVSGINCVCQWKALLPIGQRYFTVYIQDINGCISPNGVEVSILYR